MLQVWLQVLAQAVGCTWARICIEARVNGCPLIDAAPPPAVAQHLSPALAAYLPDVLHIRAAEGAGDGFVAMTQHTMQNLLTRVLDVFDQRVEAAGLGQLLP